MAVKSFIVQAPCRGEYPRVDQLKVSISCGYAIGSQDMMCHSGIFTYKHSIKTACIENCCKLDIQGSGMVGITIKDVIRKELLCRINQVFD